MATSAGGARLRAAAAQAVHAVHRDGRSLDAALADAEAGLPADARPLLRHLCYETLRHHWYLRGILGLLLSKPLRRRDAVIEDLLAVGLAQLLYTRIAPHAAVSETVAAAATLGHPKLKGLVNAVLRRFQREAPVPDGAEAQSNHPSWMLQELQADWPNDWPAIVAANNGRAPMWLRVSPRHTTVADWQAAFAAAHPDAAPPREQGGLPLALCLAEPLPVDALPGFADGHVSVQDGAAQLAAPWLLAHGGERILDACAAPGGKTAHLSELAGPAAALTAIDNDTNRLERVRETMTRTGGRATVLPGDASNPQAWWDGQPFDRILVDAPCSASGVIRRHPDIRLLRRPGDIAALAARQGAILDALWPLLTTGGRLLYVTCSVFAAENDKTVGAFLGRTSDAQEDSVLPNNNIRALMIRKAAGWQLLPGTADLDGFYFACLTKAA